MNLTQADRASTWASTFYEPTALSKRIEVAREANKTRCQQISDANYLRRTHGIRTEQEFMNVLNNTLGCIEVRGADSMASLKQRLADFVSDLENELRGDE